MTKLQALFRFALVVLASLVFLATTSTVQAIDRTVNNTRVTAADVAAAIRASPTASRQLQDYANAVGNLAMFESGGSLSVYNGSCCYGVLQMNNSNIASIKPPITPDQFRRLPLQDQVNAWSRIMTDALRTYPARTLASLGTFDGRPVTPSLVLACVQLGVGNCMTMIRSGRCTGFADINGTTICRMADRIDGTTTPTNSGSNPTTPAPGTGSAPPTITPLNPSTPIGNCIADGQGQCLSISQAINQGFIDGSGHSMLDLRNLIQSLTVGMTLLVCAWLVSGLWREYTNGRVMTADLLMGSRSVLMIAGIIFVVMSVV